jgi:hypothetical protein
LLSVIAEHSVALLAVVRAMAESAGATETPQPPDAPPTGSGPSGPDDEPPPSGPGRYQHIPVTVEE